LLEKDNSQEETDMPRDSQPTKERILASAERLFADNGFDGVSMRGIAADRRPNSL